MQAVICTHSPEMLATAFDRENCKLLHLRNLYDISPILPQDKLEVFEALKSLGNQTSDVLFWKGGIFVEGRDDIDLLETGFSDKVSGYKITSLGGRDEVEKQIKILQANEKEGKLESIQCFIFDLDKKPTDLQSLEKVKIIQWDRYCLENYLLDADIIYDVCNLIKMKNKPVSRGLLPNILKELALNQIRLEVTKEVYSTLEPHNPGLRSQEIDKAENYEIIAKILVNRLIEIKKQLDKIDDTEKWCTEFTEKCKDASNLKTDEWEQKWHILCNGKRVISDFYKNCGMHCSVTEFKKTIITEMKKQKAENWRLVESIIEHALIEAGV